MVQELMDHKEATLNVLLAKIPEVSTFADIGELVGYSSEWVRQRLTRSPDRLFKVGNRYRVPRGVAEDLVRSVFS
jgi:DNA-binding Lrp family transcriptional regulator